MPVQIHCPNPDCDASYSVDDDQIGELGRCKVCGTEFLLAPHAMEGVSPSDSGLARLSVSRDPDLPESLGRYKILRILGRGGMGTVYLALDTMLGRQVALKVPHREFIRDPEARRRFFREARSAAKFDHPSFCPIFDVGEVDGVPYLTMAYIEGQTLSAMIERGQGWSPRRAAEVARKLAVALAELHRQGVVHRDLKPANVMVKTSGDLVLMDFVLARRYDLEDPTITSAGAFPGNPAYLTPEQVEGNFQAIGPRSDIYSMGVILYELLTGRRPFEGPMAQVVYKIAITGPPPPSAHRADLDPALESICLRAMARKPEDRFASMDDLVRELKAWLDKGQARYPDSMPSMAASPESSSPRPDRAGRGPRPIAPPAPAPTSSPRAKSPRRETCKARSDPPRVPTEPRAGSHQPPFDEIQFTVYRPKSIQPGSWHLLLAFAHLADRRPDAPEGEPDPIAKVRAQARKILGPQAREFRDTSVDALQSVPHAAEITLLPDVAGIKFNPERRSFCWLEDVHREEFRICADATLEGTTARGRLSAYLGSILLAEVAIAIGVDSNCHERVDAGATEPEESTARPFRKIFASYSHKDVEIVRQYEAFMESSGDRYLRDVQNLRSGEKWNPRLMELIDEADVFQLFWSSNSMRSRHVQSEWEHAWALGRPEFIRPTYWEDPLPESRDEGLPPEPLRELHFHQLAASLPASVDRRRRARRRLLARSRLLGMFLLIAAGSLLYSSVTCVMRPPLVEPRPNTARVAQAARFLDTDERSRLIAGHLNMGAKLRDHKVIGVVAAVDKNGEPIPNGFGIEVTYEWDTLSSIVVFLFDESGTLVNIRPRSNAILHQPFSMANAAVGVLGKLVADQLRDQMTQDDEREVQKFVDASDAKGLLIWTLNRQRKPGR